MSGYSQPQDFDLYSGAVHYHPCNAWLQIEASGPGSAGIDDEPPAGSLDEWLVRVAEHDDIGGVSRQQLLTRRTAQLVPMAHVNRVAIDFEVETGDETGLAARIGVAVDGLDRSNPPQLRQHSVAHVSGVKNQLDAAKRAEQFRANKPMRIRN